MSQSSQRRAAIEKWLAARAEATPETYAGTGTGGRISLAQRGLWFQGNLKLGENTGSAFCYRLRGPLDHAALSSALDAVVRRHEPLRTRYVYEHGEPVMVVDEPMPVSLEVVPVESPDKSDAIDWLAPSIQRFATEPFDLAADYALRVRLWRIRQDDHVLTFVVHHIAFDGWSLGVFQNEVSHSYAQFIAGRAAALPPLPTTYRAFAESQRLALDEGRFTEHAAYWRRQLHSAPPFLNVPTDRPRPTVQTFAGAMHPYRIPAHICEKLAAHADQESASLPMALLAGFAAFLGRWSRIDDVVIGLPVANRMDTSLEQLIGIFVNLLPIRVRLDGVPTFRELLRQVRSTTLSAFDHQRLPFDQIVQDHRRPEEDHWSTPLVNVTLALQTADRGQLAFGEVSAEPVMIHERTSIFDITLTMAPDAGGYAGYLEYNRELFDPETIRRMAGALTSTLSRCAREPTAPISAPAPADAGGAPSVRADRSTRDSLLIRFSQTADTSPDLPATRGRHGELTYLQLRTRVESLAADLSAHGVSEGSIVGVHLPSSEELLIAFLAVLWSGAVYLPLDPAHPPSRLAQIAEDSGAKYVVTLPGDDSPWLAGRTLLTPRSGSAARTTPTPVTDTAPAYLLYTSGSTGRPKGVLISRSSLDNLVAAQDELPVAGLSRFAAMATPSFDASVWELVLALGRRGRLDFCDVETLAEDLAAFQTQVVTATPSVLATLEQLPGSVELAIAAGEPLSDALAQRLGRSAGVVNAYGPTEATVCVSFSATAFNQDTRSIGVPLRGVDVYLLDDALHEVPRGAVGEICVGGAGVALGYHADAELTRERFPLHRGGAERIYRTGDLGRWGNDGCLYFLGRADDQVKLNGQRIHLGEIENAAQSAPSVTNAAAYLRSGAAGTHLGLAVCTAESSDDANAIADVERSCRDRLPPGVVPTHIWVTRNLPLTASGKLDRAALSAAAPAASAPGPLRGASPQTEVEVAVSEIWAAVLDTPVDRIDRTLYSLGGQSLQAVRIIFAVRERFGVRVALRDFLSEPTIAALAYRVTESLKS